MILLITLVGLFFSILLIGIYYGKTNIVKSLVFGTTFYFFLYVFVSIFFFFFEQFGILRVVATCAAIELFALVILYIKGKRVVFIFKFTPYLVPILISVIMIPILGNSFGFYGMGQDQGVYQTKAIDLLYGSTSTQMDFTEYSQLQDEDLKSSYRTGVTSLHGFDNYDFRKPTLSREGELSEVSGIFHGIPTFPAILALSAKIFGIQNMAGIQALFWALSLFFIYFAAEKLQLKKRISYTLLIVYTLSPVVMWVTKSSLTEMFLTLIISSFIYFLVDTDKKSILMSAIPIVIYSLYHVTIYTMIPLFIILYYILFFYSKNKRYLYSSIIVTAAFPIGYTIMTYLSPTYSFNNAASLYEMVNNIINDNNVRQVFWAVSIIVIIVDIILLKMKNYTQIKKLENISLWNWIIKILMCGSYLIIIKNIIKLANETGSIQNGLIYSSLIGYALVSGVILLVIIIANTLISTKEYLQEKNKIILLIIFVYAILIHSAFLRADIPYYYYYARYLVPYVPLILLLGGVSIRKHKNWIIGLVNISMVALFILYGRTLIIEQDDTRMEWGVLEEIAENLNPNDAIIINSSLMETLFIPLKEIAGVDVYPDSEFNDKLIAEILERYENVYMITTEVDFTDDYSIVYKKNMTRSEAKDIFYNLGNVIPFPVEFIETNVTITMYLYNNTREQLVYSFAEVTANKVQGFSKLENDFVWTNKQYSYISGYLNTRDYKLVIEHGPGIPLAKLDKKYVEYAVYMNNQYLETIRINTEDGNRVVEIDIPQKYVSEGENILKFKSELWSPTDFGSSDSRKLGISIRRITFQE